MSDRKKAFWFIALLSVLVVVPFLGETIFYSKGCLLYTSPSPRD